MKSLKIIYTIFLLAALFFAASCANPVTPDILDLNKDNISPVITITSPAEGSSYGKTIKVTGTVSDSTGTESSTSGVIKSLTYSVAAAGIEDEEIIFSDGVFEFEFTDAALSGTIIITVEAVDTNDNTAVKNLTLIYSGNDIPDFKALPGDKKITLCWPEVVGDNITYTVYYSLDDTAPSKYYNNGILSVTVEPDSQGIISYDFSSHQNSELENGRCYSFILNAESTGEQSVINVSDVKKAVPLANTTLCPKITEISIGLKIEWNSIDGTDAYNIYRKDDLNTEITRIAYNYSDTVFIDTNTTSGRIYSYSVEPSMENSVRSSLSSFVASSVRQSPSISTFTKCNSEESAVEISGDYAYVADGMDESTGRAVLSVYELSEESPPEFKTRLLMPLPDGVADPEYSAEDIIISGNIAYLRTKSWNDGYRVNLWSVNIINPLNPVTIDTWIPPITGFSSQQYIALYSSGGTDYLYFAKNADSPALYKLETSDGNFNTVITYTGPGGSFNHIAVVGDYVVSYMFGGSYDSQTIMIPHTSIDSNSTTGILNHEEPALDSSYDAQLFAGDDKYLYAFYYAENDQSLSNLACFDYSGGSLSEVSIERFGVIHENALTHDFTPSEPALINRIMIDGEVNALSLKDDYCILLIKKTQQSGYLKAWNFTNHFKPEESLHTDINTVVSDISISDTSITLTGAHGIMNIYTADEAAPSTGSFLDGVICSDIVNLSDGLYAVTVGPAYMGAREDTFLATRLNFIPSVSAEDMASTVLTPTPEDSVRDFASVGNYVFIAFSDDGIYIIDMSSSAEPQQIGHISSSLQVSDIEARGNYLFASEGSAVRVIDITDIDNPVEKASFACPDYITDIKLSGDYLYLSIKDNSEIQRWNINQPVQPVLDSVYDIPFFGSAVCLSDSSLFVLSGESLSSYGDPLSPLFCIIDISSPAGSDNIPYTVFTEITEIGTDPAAPDYRLNVMNTTYTNRKICTADDFLFISGINAFHAYNIKDIEHPYYIKTLSSIDETYGMGNYPYLIPAAGKLLMPGYAYINVFDY